MDFKRLLTTLKTELMRNKAKSLALAAVTLVAIWFWAPLIKKWTGWGSGRSKGSTETASDTSDAVAEAEAAVAKAKAATTPVQEVSWKEALQWRRTTLKMASARWDKTARSPFKRRHPPKQRPLTAQTNSAQQGENTAEEVVLDPADFLELTATFVGIRSQWATINGRRRRIGDRIPLMESGSVGSDGKGQRLAPEEFELREVHADHVVLWRNEKRFPLKMKPSRWGRRPKAKKSTSPAVNGSVNNRGGRRSGG